MKIQTFIVLSLAATVLALPDFRSRRQATNATTTTTMAPSKAADCGDNSPLGLVGLLAQVGNLLDNLLMNVGKIQIAGVLGGKGSLINLTGLLIELRILLTSLLGGGNGATPVENEGLLSSLIGQITKLLDALLGNGTGQQYACNNSGGSVGRLLESLLGNVQNLLTGTIELNLLQPLLSNLLGTVAALLAVLV